MEGLEMHIVGKGKLEQMDRFSNRILWVCTVLFLSLECRDIVYAATRHKTFSVASFRFLQKLCPNSEDVLKDPSTNKHLNLGQIPGVLQNSFQVMLYFCFSFSLRNQIIYSRELYSYVSVFMGKCIFIFHVQLFYP